MKHLIKKILKEDSKQRFINLMVNKIKSGSIKAPYFKNLEEKYGLDKKEIEDILSTVFNGIIENKKIYDKVGNEIYHEYSGGYWDKWEYDEMGNEISYEDSGGGWWKREYDNRGNQIYHEDSGGYWWEKNFDEMSNLIYFNNNLNQWYEYQYDDRGNLVQEKNYFGNTINYGSYDSDGKYYAVVYSGVENGLPHSFYFITNTKKEMVDKLNSSLEYFGYPPSYSLSDMDDDVKFYGGEELDSWISDDFATVVDNKKSFLYYKSIVENLIGKPSVRF